ncbi:hypothetical protein CEXT_138851, partial [Caerostris extrusa]
VLGSTIKVASERNFLYSRKQFEESKKGSSVPFNLNVIRRSPKVLCLNTGELISSLWIYRPRFRPLIHVKVKPRPFSLDFLSLRRVIQSFIWRKMYIPYRESLLTRLLKVKAVNSDLREKKDKEKSYEKMKTCQPLRTIAEANILMILS